MSDERLAELDARWVAGDPIESWMHEEIGDELRRARESESRLVEAVREAIESLKEGFPGTAQMDLERAISKWEQEK